MLILGIESSCDETAVSVVSVVNDKINVLSNVILSQIEIHKKYGGVVPEVAAREHVLNILPVFDESLKLACVELEKIDLIAVTCGPGLVSSLMVGVETAKSISYVCNIPLISVNHIEGHIYSAFIDDFPVFPCVILTVSGGHTILVLMKNHSDYEILGETRDDAAGEAFDKVAKLMDVGYPGGPIISRLAKEASDEKIVSILPRPMIDSANFDFSFSGLKTAFLYELKKDKGWQDKKAEYAREFEQAVVDVLISKALKAVAKYNVKTVVLTGGVSANKKLRSDFEKIVEEKFKNEVKFICPDFKYTTDNATMIAVAGYFNYKNGKIGQWNNLKAESNIEL